MLFQINFTDLKTNEGINNMSTNEKTYTQSQVNQMIENLRISMQEVAPQDSLEQILSEIDKVSQGILGFSEQSKKSIKEFTEAINDYNKHPHYQKRFADAILDIVNKEEIRLRLNKDFTENKFNQNLRLQVIKLQHRLKY